MGEWRASPRGTSACLPRAASGQIRPMVVGGAARSVLKWSPNATRIPPVTGPVISFTEHLLIAALRPYTSTTHAVSTGRRHAGSPGRTKRSDTGRDRKRGLQGRCIPGWSERSRRARPTSPGTLTRARIQRVRAHSAALETHNPRPDSLNYKVQRCGCFSPRRWLRATHPRSQRGPPWLSA